jgi:hypothetical protein
MKVQGFGLVRSLPKKWGKDISFKMQSGES